MHVVALLLAMIIPSAGAYPPEVPLFEQTEFRNEYGMFRWYEGCWFRIRHNYAYIICSPNGEPVDRVPLSSIPKLVKSGLLPADSRTGRLMDRLINGTSTGSCPSNYRLSAGRTTAAPGDGTRLSDLFGGGTSGTRGSGNRGSAGGTGIFQFDGINLPNFGSSNFGGSSNGGGNGFSFGGSGFDGYSNVNRFGPRDNDGATFRFSSDGSAGGNGEGVLGRPFLEGCSSINDSKDGGPLGPIPCTTYPDVLGPIPKY